MGPKELIDRRLANQQLTRTDLTQPAEVVVWLGAMQAQDFTGAKWSLGLRLPPTTDRAIEQAYDEGRIVRTHVMRPTWHFVTPADIRWLQALTGPRVQQVNAGRYRQLALDAETLVKAADIMVASLRRGPRTRGELTTALEAAGIVQATGQRLAYLLMWAELEALICSGPQRGKQFTYMALDDRVPPTPMKTAEEALAELLRRYFRSHGPATDYDFARWSGLTLSDTRRGLASIRHELAQVVVDGQTYWLVPDTGPAAPVRPGPTPTACLVSIYDEYTIGYKDRRLIGSDELSRSLSGLGNALQNVILLDGRLAGTWRRLMSDRRVTAELNPLIPLTAADRQAIDRAAEQLARFLERPVDVV